MRIIVRKTETEVKHLGQGEGNHVVLLAGYTGKLDLIGTGRESGFGEFPT